MSSLEWQDFCSLLLDRFGRDEHDVLIRQLLHIRQTSTVAEYITQFAELIDQLAAYESPIDPRHYTMKFIDGLRADIRSIVLLQRPKDLDTACLLASLQEEVTDPTRSKEVKKSSFSPYLVSAVRGAHPLPPPPIYIWGGSLPPPCRQLEGRTCRPAGGRQAPSKDLCAK